METKNSTKKRLDELFVYSLRQGRDESMMRTMMIPLVDAVNSYYDLDITSNVSKAIEAITHGLIRTRIIYEDGSSHPAGGTPPVGWDNVLEIFETIDNNLLVITEEAFNASINEVTPVGDESSTPAPYYQSNIVDDLIMLYTLGESAIVEELSNIAQYGNSIGLGNSLQNLLEPKEVAFVPKLDAIAFEIYINRKYKELIETRELDIYIPSSLGGEK